MASRSRSKYHVVYNTQDALNFSWLNEKVAQAGYSNSNPEKNNLLQKYKESRKAN